MTQHFTYDDELDRIDLGGDFWVDIKRRMSYDDDERLTGHFLKLRLSIPTRKSDKVVLEDIELQSAGVFLLQLNIKNWNLVDKAGKLMPLNPENIAHLNRSLAAKIKSEINKRNPAPKV